MRPSAWSQHARLWFHCGVDVPMAAIVAAEPQMDQRHVTVARIDEGLQVRVA
jgi:hypothetical protein